MNVFVDFGSAQHGKIDIRLICRVTHEIIRGLNIDPMRLKKTKFTASVQKEYRKTRKQQRKQERKKKHE